MFDWTNYIIALLRNVVSMCAFIGGTCAFLEHYIVVGIVFIVIYAFAATDESWFFIPPDSEDDDDDSR